jgi:hypothetical protein
LLARIGQAPKLLSGLVAVKGWFYHVEMDWLLAGSEAY